MRRVLVAGLTALLVMVGSTTSVTAAPGQSEPIGHMVVTAKRTTDGLDTVIRYTAKITGQIVPYRYLAVYFTSPYGQTACSAVAVKDLNIPEAVATCSVRYNALEAVLGLIFPNDNRFPPAVGRYFTGTTIELFDDLRLTATGRIT